ncbi:MAG: autotransporter outer membrane beta-barrel domain-containing protein, partial [Planctomycetes bacterium]|nr:autotransporter outer membrane beta-barrel domain-containing protein [Planctomycetota bacterium]
GSYVHESGVFLEGGLGYGHAWNKYTVGSIATPGGSKNAEHDSDIFTADLELGYIARLPQDFNLTPSIGFEYSRIWNSSWTEKVNNAALVANRFDADHHNGIDIPVGIRFNKLFRFGWDGGFVIPEIRAAYVYSANKNRPSIISGFAGAPGGAKMVGVDPGRSHWRVGAGISGRITSRVDVRIDYDFETRSGFRDHNLNASVGVTF